MDNAKNGKASGAGKAGRKPAGAVDNGKAPIVATDAGGIAGAGASGNQAVSAEETTAVVTSTTAELASSTAVPSTVAEGPAAADAPATMAAPGTNSIDNPASEAQGGADKIEVSPAGSGVSGYPLPGLSTEVLTAAAEVMEAAASMRQSFIASGNIDLDRNAYVAGDTLELTRKQFFELKAAGVILGSWEE